MAYGPGLVARLGLDRSDYQKGLTGARTDFRSFARGMAGEGQSAGMSIGGKLSQGLERSVGLKHAFLGLFAALGLNMAAIGQKLASIIVGGSKEAWQKAGDIADRETQLIEQKIERNLGSEKMVQYLQDRLKRAMQPAAGPESFGDRWAKSLEKIPLFGKMNASILRGLGLATSQADKLAAANQRSVDILEAEAALEEKNVQERAKAIAKAQEDDAIAIGKLKTEDAINFMLKRYVEILKERNAFAKGTAEWDEKDKQLRAATLKLGDLENKRQTDERTKAEQIKALQETRLEKLRAFEIEQAEGEQKTLLIRRELGRLDKEIAAAGDNKVRQQELINQKTETELDLRRQMAQAEKTRTEAQKELDAATGDRSKMRLTELASVGRFQVGAGAQAQEQGAEARRALQLEQDAETARLGGDRGKAESLFGQADQIRKSLVSQGALKTEEAPMKAIVDKIETSNKLLDAIQGALKGKFVAQ